MIKVSYYVTQHGGEVVGLARIVWDAESGLSTSCHYANRGTATWVATNPGFGLRVQGTGGDADYQGVDRVRAMELLSVLGNSPDEIDASTGS